MPESHPVIFVPGITATYLDDLYPLPPETIWSVLTKDYERAALHPDDLRYEAKEPAKVVPGQVYEIAYKEFVDELRYNLRKAEDDPVPVYVFGYDWRHPLPGIEAQLAAFVEEVIERTKVMRNYFPDYAKAPKVNLVGHSMGGLVIAGYLANEAYARRRRIAKVATLATPFQGSFEAVIKVITGTANLGTKAPSSREREAARLTPALYHLMPSFRRGLDIDPSLPRTLFDPKVWQPSVTETIAEFIRLKGRDPKKTGAAIRRQAEDTFKGLLGAARRHRTAVNTLDPSKAGVGAKDWLCVVGVDSETRVRLKVEARGGRGQFVLQSSDRMNHWPPNQGRSEAERRATGDGTVPFEGAVPKFLPYESLVCVSPDDFGYWEWADKATLALGGFHGILPNMNMLHRLVVRHLTGRGDPHGNTWGRPPPGVADRDWKPPVPGLAPKH